jgi:hypothetical protein
MWALNPKVPMPTADELKKAPIEHTPKQKAESLDPDKEAAKKMFPFMLRVTYPKVIVIEWNGHEKPTKNLTDK